MLLVQSKMIKKDIKKNLHYFYDMVNMLNLKESSMIEYKFIISRKMHVGNVDLDTILKNLDKLFRNDVTYYSVENI